MWQDIVIMCVEVVFIIALLPTLFGRSYPPRSTNLLTAGGLTVLSICLLTMDLWFAGISQAVVATEWWLIAYRKSRSF